MKTKPSSGKRKAARDSEPCLEKLLELLRPRHRARLSRLLAGLPQLNRQRLRVRFRPSLWALRGKLRTRPPGVEVHAASFPRRGLVLLETALQDRPQELARILAHEIFHFVWFRLGNPLRRSWEALLRAELEAGAQGELGYSAERCKRGLTRRYISQRSRRWREYLCESFCDTGAWWILGQRHAEFTLAQPWRARRKTWFRFITR